MGYVLPPRTLAGFPAAEKVRGKTRIPGTHKVRRRWKDDRYIYEWDYQHGHVEKYDLRGRHLGSFDPVTRQRKDAPDPKRVVEP